MSPAVAAAPPSDGVVRAQTTVRTRTSTAFAGVDLVTGELLTGTALATRVRWLADLIAVVGPHSPARPHYVLRA